MSQKAQKPIFSGQRLKTRKRDEKEKYDPSSFRDAIILGLKESSNDLEQVSKFLDSGGSRFDYRRYAEVLFDILFTGGQLAPGGGNVHGDQSRAEICVFNAEENVETLKAFYEVFYKLFPSLRCNTFVGQMHSEQKSPIQPLPCVFVLL